MSEPDETSVVKAATVAALNEAGKTYLRLSGLDEVSAGAIAAAAVATVVEVPAGLQRLRERRAGRIVRFARLLESYTARELDDLVSSALDDEQKVEMLWRVVETVQRTADERRVRAYAKLVADGVLAQEQAKVEVADRVVAGLASLDVPDLAVLSLMETKYGWFMRHTNPESANPTPTVLQHFPGYDPILDAISARLNMAGMIRLGGEGGGLTVGAAWRVTEFGTLCLQKLAEGDALGWPSD